VRVRVRREKKMEREGVERESQRGRDSGGLSEWREERERERER
jgi:hypothetical protein